MASQLSASARSKAEEALDRRNTLTRLFDVTRDILLTTERDGALAAIARHVARRFELEVVAICVPAASDGWDVHHGGASAPDIAAADLDRAFAAASGAIEFDARTRAYGGHREMASASGPLALVPVRIGTRAIGILATGGRPLEPGTRDAIAGIVAIALERAVFLRERDAAELSRQRAELTSALLASLSHDLRTPLTAIRTAVSNLDSLGLTEDQRRDQARVASDRDRPSDAAVRRDSRHGADRRQERPAPARLDDAGGDRRGRGQPRRGVDRRPQPAQSTRATTSRLRSIRGWPPPPSHTCSKTPPGMRRDGAIEVRAWTDGEGLRIEVRDAGPGLEAAELERLFEPFYRGEHLRQRVPGTGMGLAITRGLIAADGGRVWAENVAPNGASFNIAIPARTRQSAAAH